MADIAPSPDACVSIAVQHAFSGSAITSMALLAAHSVFELKLRLEEATGVPAEYQTLLRQGDVVPLHDASTLLEEGLGPQSKVLFIQREPRRAAQELWELCQGCPCNFGERGMGSEHCSDLSQKFCGCQIAAGDGPRMSAVRYLQRYLPDDGSPLLQILFERTVLGGGSEGYTALASHFVSDLNVDVNAVGCDCDATGLPPSLLKMAMFYGHVNMCRVLMDSGKLRVDYKAMCRAITVLKRDTDSEWPGGDDTAEILRWAESVVRNEFGVMCKFINEQRLQAHPWCKEFVECYRRAIFDVCLELELPRRCGPAHAALFEDPLFEDPLLRALLESPAEQDDDDALEDSCPLADPVDTPACSGHFARKQGALLASHRAKRGRAKYGERHFGAGEAKHSRPRARPTARSTRRRHGRGDLRVQWSRA